MTHTTDKASRLFCEVYRSSKVEGLYVYIERGAELETLPDALMERMGKPTRVLQLVLTPDKKLARADAAKVMQQIESEGYYVQMPPADFVKGEL